MATILSADVSKAPQVHTTQEGFENGGFTMKTQQMFSVNATSGKFENAKITGHLVFVFEYT